MQADDAALVRAAKVTPEAFAVLYERHYPAVFAFASRRARDMMQAEDITAQTFIRALAALGRFQDRGAPFAAWLLRIAANEVAEQGRRRALRERLTALAGEGTDGLAGVDTVDQAADWERAAWLRSHLAALSADQRRVVWLRFWEDRAVDDVAAQIGRSPGATKQLLHRALKTLRARLQADAPVPA